MPSISRHLPGLVRDDSGSQVIEYALILATVSIALVVLLQPLTVNGNLTPVIDRFFSCLSGQACS
jgi:pilus assembly protein Flp/PilA